MQTLHGADHVTPGTAVNQSLEVSVLFVGEVAFCHAVTSTAVYAVDTVLNAKQNHLLVQNPPRRVA